MTCMHALHWNECCSLSCHQHKQMVSQASIAWSAHPPPFIFWVKWVPDLDLLYGSHDIITASRHSQYRVCARYEIPALLHWSTEQGKRAVVVRKSSRTRGRVLPNLYELPTSCFSCFFCSSMSVLVFVSTCRPSASHRQILPGTATWDHVSSKHAQILA